MKDRKHGTCKLTGTYGKFVKSHIIPKSLTPREAAGAAMFQSDGLDRPIRRFDSWYDAALVIRKGEDILEEIDARALQEMRRHKLAWRFWETLDELGLEPFQAGAARGIRILNGVDHIALAKFAISVLWRAGASELPDMQNFRVPETTLTAAREIVNGTNAFDPTIFPIKVFQFAPKGPLHNLTTMNHEMDRPDGLVEHFFRIFANGLFFHITDTTKSQPYDLGQASWYLGNQDRLSVICFDFYQSTQYEFTLSALDSFRAFKNSKSMLTPTPQKKDIG